VRRSGPLRDNVTQTGSKAVANAASVTAIARSSGGQSDRWCKLFGRSLGVTGATAASNRSGLRQLESRPGSVVRDVATCRTRLIERNASAVAAPGRRTSAAEGDASEGEIGQKRTMPRSAEGRPGHECGQSSVCAWMARLRDSFRRGGCFALTRSGSSTYSRSVKEVIQPQVPLRLPCYDFAPVTALAFGRLLPGYPGLRHGLRALTASMA
jgi:hypothetical protein